jgi:DNA-binding NarL/FixJ family response regulator
MKIKTFIVDDHPMILYGIRSLLDRASDIEIVGEALNGCLAIERASELSPDVIIMDLSMPDMNGFEATRRILQESPQMRVVALSMYSDTWNVHRAMQEGMSGYLLKNCTAGELLKAIRYAFRGKTYFCPAIKRLMKRKNGYHFSGQVQPQTAEL